MKLISLILFALFFVPKCESLAGIQQSDCGLIRTDGSTSQGQASTLPRDQLRDEMPWLVGIVVEKMIDTNPDKTFQWCTGVVVNEYWILTAARCFNVQPHEQVHHIYAYIQLLKHVQISFRGSSVQVSKTSYFRHPYYYPETVYNDLALIKTDEPIPMRRNDTHYLVNGICFPNISQSEQISGSYSIAFADNNSDPRVIDTDYLIDSDRCRSVFDKILGENGRQPGQEQLPMFPHQQPDAVCRRSGGGRNVCMPGAPVMTIRNNRWQLFGLLTDTLSPSRPIPGYDCGLVDVVMKIDAFASWMAETIQANSNQATGAAGSEGEAGFWWFYGILALIFLLVAAGVVFVLAKNRNKLIS